MTTLTCYAYSHTAVVVVVSSAKSVWNLALSARSVSGIGPSKETVFPTVRPSIRPLTCSRSISHGPRKDTADLVIRSAANAMGHPTSTVVAARTSKFTSRSCWNTAATTKSC